MLICVNYLLGALQRWRMLVTCMEGQQTCIRWPRTGAVKTYTQLQYNNHLVIWSSSFKCVNGTNVHLRFS